MKVAARLIAFYLPQFHPIPENDQWWGKGFTEWTNVAKAKPLFRGHYQPHIPADLGFYDLRVPETRAAQAKMAREHGIEAFCYYHYWFGGERLLERPFTEVLRSGEPDFPFCLCWANETWTGKWHGCPEKVLINQNYPGIKDDERHFHVLLEAFHDKRYVRVDGKPMFLFYRPNNLPHSRATTDRWRELALKNGLKGLYLVGVASATWQPRQHGFDALTLTQDFHAAAFGQWRRLQAMIDCLSRIGRLGEVALYKRRYQYGSVYPYFAKPEGTQEHVHPVAIPNWDNTPRCGKNGIVVHGSTPELFRKHLEEILAQVRHKPDETRFVFIKSWNEWAEGNHL